MYTVMFAVGVFLTLMGFPCHVITQSFTGSPGIIKCNDGDTVEMRWTLSSNFETGHEFFIFEDVTADPFDPNQVVFQSGHSTCIESNTRANCLFDIGNPAQIGFTLTGVTDSDARYYTCYWETFSVGGFYNSAALLYIYKSPSTPVISGVTMVRAGQKRQLSCSSTPQSLPLTESASSVIEYTWGSSLPITINGNTAEVGPVEKSDKGVEVTCTTNEQGSTFNAQSSIRVDVIWPSESSSLTANKMSVVEKIDNLELFCTIPIGSEGNPPPHQYRWKNSNSSDPVTLTTTNRLIITKESLSVESHHGLWECTPVNDAGHGVSATMFITVRDLCRLDCGNNGVCELDVNNNPGCKCTDGYFGSKCSAIAVKRSCLERPECIGPAVAGSILVVIIIGTVTIIVIIKCPNNDKKKSHIVEEASNETGSGSEHTIVTSSGVVVQKSQDVQDLESPKIGFPANETKHTPRLAPIPGSDIKQNTGPMPLPSIPPESVEHGAPFQNQVSPENDLDNVTESNATQSKKQKKNKKKHKKRDQDRLNNEAEHLEAVDN